MICFRRSRVWHFVVFDDEDIELLIQFTMHPKVMKYAYSKHSEEGKMHYHFLFMLKCPMTIKIISNFTKVNLDKKFFFNNNVSFLSNLQYLKDKGRVKTNA